MFVYTCVWVGKTFEKQMSRRTVRPGRRRGGDGQRVSRGPRGAQGAGCRRALFRFHWLMSVPVTGREGVT